MDKEIGMGLPEKFTDKYFIYHGADTIEDMNENIERLGLNKAKCYFIKLNGQFYAVFFDSFEKEVIIGANKVFFNRNGRLNESTVGEAKIGYNISSRNVKWITDTLARELNFLYNPIEIYEYPNVNSKEYREVQSDIRLSNYVVLLALTFVSRFYTIFDAEKMRDYFIHTDELISFLKRTKGAVEIDPFSQEVRFKDGSVGTYSYKRVLESNYYTNRPNSYYKGKNIGYKTIFALEDKNKYSPYRKREWPSITRYLSMYPNDDIFYPMPDYREGKPICKWCGNPLTKGQKSYCSTDCRIDFGRAVNVERGALLPYLIMCRDKFTCKTCGKDMALINKHGMKIPIPRVSDYPDKDGVCRSEAEVDHLKSLEEGGVHHQSNLETKCDECHKKKHKKRLTKAEREEVKNHVVFLDEFKFNKVEKQTLIIDNDTLYERLRLYRLNKALEEGIRAYMIFKNTELDELVKLRPIDNNELLNIKGFGQNKVYKYGKDILNIINKI